MKTNFLRNVLYGMAMLSVAACMEEELVNEVPLEAEFEADIEAPSSAISVFVDDPEEETRTYIVEGDEVGINWRAKETIGVYGSLSKNAKFTSTNTKNAATVEFSGLLLGTPKYAYYPYSTANNGVSQTAVKGTMPTVHSYNSNYKDLTADYRAGTLDSRNWLTAKFTLNRLVSIFRFVVDATGTPLEGDNIQSISMKVSNKHKLSGDFTINLQTQALNMGAFKEGNDSLTLDWFGGPTLQAGNAYSAYMTLLPNVKAGDVLTTTIRTDKHVATFSRTAKSDFVANKIYKYAMTLKDLDLTVTEVATKPAEPEVPAVTPVLNSLKFTVADNPGKILSRTFTVKAGSNSASVSSSTAVTEAKCDIDEKNKKISLYLPYLHSRKLVPTFEIPEGTRLILESGEEVISGETEVDFVANKQIAVINSANELAIYDVELTNTGLPVVVINQQTATVSSTSDDTQKGSAAWYKATGTKWQPKDSDWEMIEGADNFMVYNADGTPALTDKNGSLVEEPILASTRVRGNVSQQMPKKPFAVKLDKKHSVLGMPAHKRWVLLAGWNDRTLMRNAIAYDIAHLFEKNLEGSIVWNPSVQHVELVYNGVHVGTYLLGEQIKIDDDRLDINDPLDEKDNPYTGDPSVFGYLLESDDGYDETTKFITKNYVPFLFKDDADAGGKMLAYVKNIVTTIEDNLYNGKYSEAYKTLDLNSMIDFLLIHEVMMNGELQHPKSAHTYINNGKMYAGPVWDFDWQTIPNISTIESYFDNAYTNNSGKASYNFTMATSMLAQGQIKRTTSTISQSSLGDVKNFIWFPMLVKDATFKDEAAKRWNAISGLITTYASTEIPAMAEKIRKSHEENEKMWPIKETTSTAGKAAQYRYMSFNVGGGFNGDELATNFDAAVKLLQDNLTDRVTSMNSYVSKKNWPSISGGSSSSSSSGSSSSKPSWAWW